MQAHPRLNELRRAVRFWQEAPRRDLLERRRTFAIFRARPFTMMNYRPLASLWNLASSLEVAGAVVECGSCNGGSGAILAAAAPGRPVWLFDSWQGLPEPGEDDVTEEGFQRSPGWNFGTLENVRKVLARLGVHASRVHLVPGWFDDTIPETNHQIGPIAFLHVDCDYYDPVKLVLTELYPQMVTGGVVAIDDYQHWRGCQKAVHEFFGDITRMPGFERVGGTVRFRKPEAN